MKPKVIYSTNILWILTIAVLMFFVGLSLKNQEWIDLCAMALFLLALVFRPFFITIEKDRVYFFPIGEINLNNLSGLSFNNKKASLSITTDLNLPSFKIRLLNLFFGVRIKKVSGKHVVNLKYYRIFMKQSFEKVTAQIYEAYERTRKIRKEEKRSSIRHQKLSNDN